MLQAILVPNIILHLRKITSTKKHIRAAKTRTASFNVKSEGEINLFEMSVELNGIKGGNRL